MSRKRKRWSWSCGAHGSRVRVMERHRGGSVYLGAYDGTTGGTRWRSLKFPVRNAEGRLISEAVEEAKAAARALGNELATGAVPRREAVTLGRLADLFRAEIVRDMEGKHRHETLRELEAFERFLGRRFDLSRFGPREWKALARARASGEIDAGGRRVANPEKRRPAAPRTVAKSLKVLRHLLRFGTVYRTPDGRFLLDVDPSRGLDLPREPNPRRPVADDSIYGALLAVADRVTMRHGKRKVRSYLRELLILAAHTGRRREALVSLRWSDWEPDAASYGVLRWRADSDKLKRDTRTPVTPEVREALEGLRREHPGIAEGWIFPAPESEGHVRGDVASRWLHRAFTFAKVARPPGFGFHSFRRMFATKLKHRSLRDVAGLGGWRDVTTLQRVYQIEDLEAMEAAVLDARPLRLAEEA